MLGLRGMLEVLSYLGNFIAVEHSRYGFDLFYVEGCGASSAEYHVHLVSV